MPHEESTPSYTVYTTKSLTIIVLFAVVATAVIITVLAYFFWVKPLSAQISELKNEKVRLKEDVVQMEETVEEKQQQLGMNIGK